MDSSKNFQLLELGFTDFIMDPQEKNGFWSFFWKNSIY